MYESQIYHGDRFEIEENLLNSTHLAWFLWRPFLKLGNLYQKPRHASWWIGYL